MSSYIAMDLNGRNIDSIPVPLPLEPSRAGFDLIAQNAASQPYRSCPCSEWRNSPFVCIICPYSALTRDEILAHMLMHHSVVVADADKISNLAEYVHVSVAIFVPFWIVYHSKLSMEENVKYL